MRYLIFLTSLIALGAGAGAMNLLSGPETVVYDSSHDRYLVSNMNEPCHIVAIDRDGRQSIFKSGLSWPHGMTIVENTLYVCTNYGTRGGVLGFDLSSGDVVFEKLSTAWHDRCNAPPPTPRETCISRPSPAAFTEFA